MVLKNILVIGLLVTSSLAYSFVPNDEYYKLADKQISQLRSELKDIESTLELNPTNETALQLKSNLEQEIKLIKKRVKFYKKLESSGLIVYSK